MAGDEQDRLRARARLALRAEQAFGLQQIPMPAGSPTSTDVAAPQVESPAPAPRDQELHPTPQSTPGANLFGAPEPAPQRVGKQLPIAPAGPFTTPKLSADEKRARLIAMDNNEVRGCTRCRLHERRTHTVFGEGAADAKIFFIGEGPGENEDLTGRPFVGKAGQLLDKQIAAMGLKREQVFIANIVKCRPPGNREPAPDEVATCTPYLERQLEIVRPKVIVTLGRPAAQHMLQSKLSMSRLRGQWHDWRGIKLMPTFHPAYLLRSYTRENREMVWSDLQEVMREVGLKTPSRGANE